MKYSEAIKRDDYLRLPQIDKGALKLLWFSDFWDGPKSGLLQYQGRKYWFEMFAESDDPDFQDYYRRFLIIELSDQQLKEKEYWHDLFRDKVGTHTDYEPQGIPHKEKLKPEDMWDEFYEPSQKHAEIDLSNNVVVGWYET